MSAPLAVLVVLLITGLGMPCRPGRRLGPG